MFFPLSNLFLEIHQIKSDLAIIAQKVTSSDFHCFLNCFSSRAVETCDVGLIDSVNYLMYLHFNLLKRITIFFFYEQDWKDSCGGSRFLDFWRNASGEYFSPLHFYLLFSLLVTQTELYGFI